ncbi:MAG: hypothetical protein KC414_12595 [Romboutsia sp.]|nr:hypothetical protein [Romboutsia sp.]
MENIKQYFSGKNLILIIMSLFAVGSFSNVQSFFYIAHPSLLMSVALGLGLGSALIVMAHLLHSMDVKRKEFYIALIITVALAILSGGIQAIGYTGHLQYPFNWIVGFSLPVLGELSLSIFYSVFIFDKKRKEEELLTKAKDIDAIISRKNQELLTQAALEYDGETIKTLIKKSIYEVAEIDARFHVDKKKMESAKQKENFAKEIGLDNYKEDDSKILTLKNYQKKESTQIAVASTENEAVTIELSQPEKYNSNLTETENFLLSLFDDNNIVTTSELQSAMKDKYEMNSQSVTNIIYKLKTKGHIESPSRGKWKLVS